MSIPDLIADLANLAAIALTVATAVVLGYQLVTRVLFARVVIEDMTVKDDKLDGKALSSIIRGELMNLQTEGGGESIFRVNGPDAPINLPDNAAASNFKTLAGIVDLLPGRITTLSGEIQPKGMLGRGLSLQLRGAWNRTVASVTLWDEELGLVPDHPDDAERLQRLALAASAWLTYQLLADAPPRQRGRLLTQDWASFALFLIGSRLQAGGADTDHVRRVYQNALGKDPRNRGALFGLGLVYGDEAAHRPAIQFFDACAAEVVKAYEENLAAWRLDRLWYRAKINGAIARLNERALRYTQTTSGVPGAAIPESVTSDKLRDAAQGMLLEVARIAAATIASLVGDQPVAKHGHAADLVRFLISAREEAITSYPLA